MKKPRKALRKLRKAAAPAVEMTREAAREVFKKIKSTHARAKSRLR